jgi:hypothetical protein
MNLSVFLANMLRHVEDGLIKDEDICDDFKSYDTITVLPITHKSTGDDIIRGSLCYTVRRKEIEKAATKGRAVNTGVSVAAQHDSASTTTVVEFINKMIDKQVLQYDTLFNAAIEKSELDLAFRALTLRTDTLRDWIKLVESEDA